MAPILRKLPIGLQDFAGLRKGGYLYVDKTAFIYKLATEGKQYFLGRPRRFGKSLLLSTIKYYFQGRKELFESLAIAGLEKDWTEYPVFHIDLNIGNFSTLELLDQRLDVILSRMEKEWGVDRNAAIAPSSRLETLVIQAFNKTGKGVVVLFDEYDKPLLRTMNDVDLNEKTRTVLRDFYSVMKSADAYLQFVLYTGVTKFSKISVFSDLNQPEDISMADKYAEICGITESELIQNFEPEIQALAGRQKMTYENTLAELKRKYDGYHFSEEGTGMYNPFSLLNTFSQLTFRNYWYKTGTPTFLVEMIAAGDLDIRDLSDNVPLKLQKWMIIASEPIRLYPSFTKAAI
ncbi:hypothetical protein FACS189413_18550 [Bacteroidia bacterium]|nr:hypothetical protein FACS189413_18550 [Bacteroidia bacterium]